MTSSKTWFIRSPFPLLTAVFGLLALLVAASCEGSDPVATCAIGAESCACTAAGACDPELSCLSRMCVRVVNSVAADRPDAGPGRAADPFVIPRPSDRPDAAAALPIMQDSGAASTNDAAMMASLTYKWATPLLDAFARGQKQKVFPSYVAHLIGKTIKHPVPLELACLEVSNHRTVGVTVRAQVDFKVYAQLANETISIPAGATVRTCIAPPFDFEKLYSLSSEAPGRMELALLDSQGRPGVSESVTFAVAPVGDVAWMPPAGLLVKDMRELSAALVTPKDPVVDRLQRSATELSQWKQMGPQILQNKRTGVTGMKISAGTFSYLPLTVEGDERPNFVVHEIEGGATSVEVYVMTTEQLKAFQTSTPQPPAAGWSAVSAGMGGTLPVLQAGLYHLAFINRNAVPVSITWSRGLTRRDVAVDALRSVFLALRGLKISYSNVTDTFFSAWQHVRLAGETLSALSANCFDGTLLFAGVFELVGLEAAVYFVPGHAFVGVRVPGGKTFWPIETTLVGNASVTPEEAIQSALGTMTKYNRDPAFLEMSVRTVRDRGILPLPQ